MSRVRQEVFSHASASKLLWASSICLALLTAWGARYSIPLPYTPCPSLYKRCSSCYRAWCWGRAGARRLSAVPADGLFRTAGVLCWRWLQVSVQSARHRWLSAGLPAICIRCRLDSGKASSSHIDELPAGGTGWNRRRSRCRRHVAGGVPAPQCVAGDYRWRTTLPAGDALKIAVAGLCAHGIHWGSATLRGDSLPSRSRDT